MAWTIRTHTTTIAPQGKNKHPLLSVRIVKELPYEPPS